MRLLRMERERNNVWGMCAPGADDDAGTRMADDDH